MKFWAPVNGGLRATQDAWQNRAYQLRNYIYFRAQNTPELTGREVVSTREVVGLQKMEPPGGDQGSGSEQ